MPPAPDVYVEVDVGVDADVDAGEPEAPPAPLLGLRDGLPPLTDTPTALAAACAALADAQGPVAIDAERASGYRYSSRAYLIQLRRDGAGTFLVDPIGFESLDPLQEALAGGEWILHAATQDLACLTEVGLVPATLFDTELAGRLLGYPRVGLATLVETLLGQRMKKEHSAADWSTRPLPEPWLEYAALDVEVLIELRDVLAAELRAAGKDDWARQEFDALRGFTPAVRQEPWRRTSGLHRVRGRRLLGAVRELWETRDELARNRDVSPGRIIGDSAVVAAALADPTSRSELLSTKGFHGRGAQRYADRWLEALARARELPEDALPLRAPRSDGPPTPRAWAERDPIAAERLTLARDGMARLSQEHQVPAENLLSPDTVRRVMWQPAGDDVATVAGHLRSLGAREWQIELTATMLVDAITAASSTPSSTVPIGGPATGPAPGPATGPATTGSAPHPPD
jgi:ribonuclease D